jgi:hypothetical protein
VRKAAGVIAMPVRNDDGVQVRKIDSDRFGIRPENTFVVSRIEENPNASELDERGKSPILREPRLGTEGIVEDRDRVVARRRLVSASRAACP